MQSSMYLSEPNRLCITLVSHYKDSIWVWGIHISTLAHTQTQTQTLSISNSFCVRSQWFHKFFQSLFCFLHFGLFVLSSTTDKWNVNANGCVYRYRRVGITNQSIESKWKAMFEQRYGRFPSNDRNEFSPREKIFYVRKENMEELERTAASIVYTLWHCGARL